MIKNINDLKKCQMVCREREDTKNCLNYLKQLGFDVEDFTEYCDGCNIIFWGDNSKKFIISNMLEINLPTEFYNKKLIKTLQKFIKEKQEEKEKEQKPKTIVEYLKSKPMNVKIYNRQDYDNMINYLDKQNVKWNSGDNLKSWRPNNIIKALSFYDESEELKNGLFYNSIDTNISKSITVKELFKKFNIEYKELPDFEVAEDGRITKINTKISKKEIFIACDWEYKKEGVKIVDLTPLYLDFIVKYGMAYETKEARDRAMFKLEIETKLKNIAERLNKGQKIDWENRDQSKCRIYYDYNYNRIDWVYTSFKTQDLIYCLDENFLEVAKKEIGEQNLIKYFTE